MLLREFFAKVAAVKPDGDFIHNGSRLVIGADMERCISVRIMEKMGIRWWS